MARAAERLAPAPGQSDGPRFALFCERYIRHTQGRQFAGKPLILEPFQREFFDELLAVDENGRRYYTEALWGLPRKNGKSTTVAAFGLYMTSADGEAGAEVYAAAAAKDQARIIFSQGRKFVDPEVSPDLSEEFTPRRNWIEHRPSGSIFKVISSDAPKQHGLNPSASVIDELHAHENGDLYAALTTATGAREQPLTLTITTAGWNTDTVLGEIYARTLDGHLAIERRPGLTIVRDRDSGFLFWWHGAAEGDDPEDPAVWRLANPASWISDDYLRRERQKPTMRFSDFRQLHLNQWTAAEEEWFPPGAWAACFDRSVSLEALDPAQPIAVGVDIALTHDYASVTIAQRREDRVLLVPKFWFNPHQPGTPAHQSWELDIAEVRAELRSIAAAFRKPAAYKPHAPKGPKIAAPGPAFCYDPWKFTESAQMLSAEGLNMVEVPQWNVHMVPASQALYDAVVTGRVAHGGDPILNEHMGNARGQRTDRGWRIRKPKDKSGRELENKHIDGAITAAMAVRQILLPLPVPYVRKQRAMVTS